MNICYEVAKLIYDKIEEDDVYFADTVNSINDFRRALGGLKLDSATAEKVASLVDDLEAQYSGKALYRQIDDIRRNMSGILRLLRSMGIEEKTKEAISRA